MSDELSSRIRPDVEAAPWVIKKVNALEAERDALYKANVAATAAYDQWLTESQERGQKAETERDALRAVLADCVQLFNEALPKFNWGASCLDANAIRLLNEVPTKAKAALKEVTK